MSNKIPKLFKNLFKEIELFYAMIKLWRRKNEIII